MSTDQLDLAGTTAELLASAVRDGASPPLRVRGRCMEPLLRDGDRLELAPLGAPPRLGDLLVARTADGALVCHRVLEAAEDSVLLAGDRTRRAERVASPHWLALVVGAERGGRRMRFDGPARHLDPLLARLHPARAGRLGARLRALVLRVLAARWHLGRAGAACHCLAMLVLPLLLAACADEAPPSASTAAPGSTAAPATLRLGVHSGPLTLDPHARNEVVTFQTLRHVYEGLTQLDAGSRVTPCLAERWENLDALRWRFTLREATFHDGSTLRAADVVASLERARRAEHEISSYLVELDAVRVLDERTIELTTHRPYPILLSKLAYVGIVPAAATEIGSERTASDPLPGTGPYRWLESTGDRLRLTAFADHWSGTPPAYGRVEMHVLAEAELRRAALLDGTVDLAQHLRPDDLAALRGEPCCRALSHPSQQTRYLAMRPDRPPFDDPRVRRAINLALDRRALVDRLLLGFGTPTDQLVGVYVFGHDADREQPVRDLEEARRLLAAAGHGDGLDLVLEATREEPARLIAEQLAAVGLRVEVRARPWSELFARLQAREVDFYFGGILAVTGDASDVFDSMLHSLDPVLGYGRNNAAGLDDPTLDALIEESGSTLDMDRRRELLRRAMASALEHRVYLGLYSRDALFGRRHDIAWQPRLDGFVFAWQAAPGPVAGSARRRAPR
ncbi:MAG: ABC transporter substrate-binding protein [Acidobacteriota bacterium]